MLIANTPLASYRIILPAAAMEGERDVAEVLRDTLTRATGVTLEIATDATPAADCEIVIGKTDRDTEKVISARAEDADKVEALEFVVGAGSRCIEKPLKDLRLRSNVLIAAVIHGNECIIPNGNTVISAGDRAIVVTTETGLRDLDAILE